MWDGLLRELDLCILAYQLHSQTLIWPMDPYYEQLLKHAGATTNKERRRQEFNAEVLATFRSPRAGTVQPPNANLVYHGSGALMGWAETNSTLDPIISEYERINPWQPCFVRPMRHREPWLVYNTPAAITSRIDRVVVARWTASPYTGNPNQDIVLDDLTAGAQPRLQPPANAQDWLYCFEGGTGADPSKHSDKQYVSWGLMGFVLASHRGAAPPQNYDVHIIFRGSRSGQLRPTEAGKGKGNPDWVTDLQILSLAPEPVVSQTGSVATGFAEAQKRTLPTIMRCLNDIHNLKGGAPNRIYVSGHSLGGALALHFTSAVTLGNSYAHTIQGQGDMPANVRTWPWANLTLTTFGSPATGDTTFSNALAPVHCTRVWVLADPITVLNPGGHVGASLCLAPPLTDTLSPGERHDPETIRRYLAKGYEQQIYANPNPSYRAPATAHPRTDPARPWAYFQNRSLMLGHLTAVAGYAPAVVFKDFIPNLVTYLRILKEVLNQRSAEARQASQDIPGVVGALNQQYPDAASFYAALETEWNKMNGLRTYSGTLHAYVGLCLYLATCTKGQAGQLFVQPPAGQALTTALNRF
jgi:hypothetical protein